MRQLAVLLCLSFAVLLFSAGEAWSLPKCPGSYARYSWTNCFGTHTWEHGGKYVGEWLKDRKHGQGIYTWPNGEVQEGVWKNGSFLYAREDPKVGAEREREEARRLEREEARRLKLEAERPRLMEEAMVRCEYEHIDEITSDATERIIKKKCRQELRKLTTEDLQGAYKPLWQKVKDAIKETTGVHID